MLLYRKTQSSETFASQCPSEMSSSSKNETAFWSCPAEYLCIKCNKKGDHWIMNCLSAKQSIDRSICKCTVKEWNNLWNKHENAFKSGYHQMKNINTNIGFDLFFVAHQFRDSLLIDHNLWRQKKVHHQIIKIIKKLSKSHICAKDLIPFYFDDQLFIVNKIKFSQRLLNAENLQNHSFINVSSNIKIPNKITKNMKEYDEIISSLKQIGSQIVNLFSRKKRKKNNKNTINSLDLSNIEQNLYPTICGYLLNYLFIYFANDIQSNCLNQHQLKLLKFKYNNHDIIQFSIPNIILDQMPDKVISTYCNRLNNKNMTISIQSITDCVSL